MKTKNIIVGIFIFAMAMTCTMPAGAEDFTITVPVRLYNMVQGVGKAKVTCEVVDSQGQRIGSAYKWSTHGVNQYPNGLEEDIVLKFNANPGKDPRDATDYRCDLKVQLAWVNDEPWQTPSQETDSMYLKAKPGTEFRVQDGGPLYQTQRAPQLKANPNIRMRR